MNNVEVIASKDELESIIDQYFREGYTHIALERIDPWRYEDSLYLVKAWVEDQYEEI